MLQALGTLKYFTIGANFGTSPRFLLGFVQFVDISESSILW
jgi:hypothetical protein